MPNSWSFLPNGLRPWAAPSWKLSLWEPRYLRPASDRPDRWSCREKPAFISSRAMLPNCENGWSGAPSIWIKFAQCEQVPDMPLKRTIPELRIWRCCSEFIARPNGKRQVATFPPFRDILEPKSARSRETKCNMAEQWKPQGTARVTNPTKHWDICRVRVMVARA